MILIGLLHKSRKAKEKEREREREESEGWVKFVPMCRPMRSMLEGMILGTSRQHRVCSAVLSLDCKENFTSL